MAKKEFTYRGKKGEELGSLSLSQYAEMIPSRQRRKIKRGFTEAEKALIAKLEKGKDNVDTHCRDMIIIPIMFGKTIKIHTGKEFQPVTIVPEMAGHVLGEFALSRKITKHSSPGVGATKSSGATTSR